tara:strand:+ start:219 stop:587 length:369 start_codon:yes stop_codon:yes gene_type:complete
VTEKKQFNLSKEEKKKLVNYFYKQEENRWVQASKAYYTPEGAPGRLSEELLDQWHAKHNTGIKHPGNRKPTLVKVMFDERSFTVKSFLTKAGAREYILAVEHYGIQAEVIDEDHVPKFMGVF